MSYLLDRWKQIQGTAVDRSKNEEDCYSCKVATGSIFTAGGVVLFFMTVSGPSHKASMRLANS